MKQQAILHKDKLFLLSKILFILFVFAVLFSCQKLDSDGGFYNKKTKSYQYVHPSKRAVTHIGLTNYANKDIGFNATIYKVSSQADSLWLYVDKRRLYMSLASRMSKTDKDDQHKLIKLHLAYVSPSFSLLAKPKVKKRWVAYTSRVMNKILLKKQVMIRGWFLKTGLLKAVVFLPTQGSVSRVKQELNLWLVYQGYSYYFQDKNNQIDKLYKQAQTHARQKRLGLWRL